jgi:uroporphyrinogen decarboxylase
MITGTQRLLAAINGQTSDRIPVFCNLLDQGAKELGVSIKDYYSNGQYVAEAQLKMREKYGYDNVWSLFYVGKEAELLGAKEIIFSKEGPPNVADFIIKTYDDIHRLEVPSDVSKHPAFEEGIKCLHILKKEVGNKYPICAYITSTMTLPALLMGMEKWLELLFLGPSELRNELLAKCHDFFVKEMAVYRQAGADVLVYSNPFGSTDIVPMNFFMQYSLPWIKKDIEAVGVEGIVYYCGMARMNQVIDAVFAQTGIGVYYLSPMDDVRAGKNIIAGRALTCGVINDIRLIDWSQDQVRDEVKNIIDGGKPGGRFLFGTGVMPFGIPEDNIRAMLETAYEFGRYEE